MKGDTPGVTGDPRPTGHSRSAGQGMFTSKKKKVSSMVIDKLEMSVHLLNE